MGEVRPAGVGGLLRMRAWWVAVGAVAAYELGIMLLNVSVFPLFNGVFLGARDVGSIFSALLMLALYVLVSTRPNLCRPRAWMAACAVMYFVGVPVMLVGARLGAPAVLLAGVLLRSVASCWFGTTLCLALVDLGMAVDARGVFASLAAGWAASYALELAVTSLLPTAGCLVVFCAAALAVMVLTYGSSARVMARTLASAPMADLRVTNPRAFLPWGSALFVTVVVLKASFGFAMTFASVGAQPQATILACVPALLVALALLASGRVGLDALYRATMLCVLAGFLLVNPLISSITAMPSLANVVLRAGGDLSRMLAFMVVVAAGVRNPTGAMGVSLFVGGAGSLGSVAGAQLGMLANAAAERDPALLALLLAVVVFAFVAYNVLVPDVFDLDGAARAVEPVPAAAPQPSVPVDVLTQAAARVAKRLALTPRESEALELLAHGRNVAAIQERMVISRSTARTHVRNVYAKLGVHSQQALIDLVESEI